MRKTCLLEQLPQALHLGLKELPALIEAVLRRLLLREPSSEVVELAAVLLAGDFQLRLQLSDRVQQLLELFRTGLSFLFVEAVCGLDLVHVGHIAADGVPPNLELPVPDRSAPKDASLYPVNGQQVRHERRVGLILFGDLHARLRQHADVRVMANGPHISADRHDGVNGLLEPGHREFANASGILVPAQLPLLDEAVRAGGPNVGPDDHQAQHGAFVRILDDLDAFAVAARPDADRAVVASRPDRGADAQHRPDAVGVPMHHEARGDAHLVLSELHHRVLVRRRLYLLWRRALG
mmetsp:Transcript_44572/g.128856  ORF Transcript_44572/g.128856 Transcript_44572/m.128856 type:complete len:294 (-) Transcript_44572:801-1682(-)